MQGSPHAIWGLGRSGCFQEKNKNTQCCVSLTLSRDTLGRSCIPWKWSASARAKGPSTTGMPSKRRLDIAVERVSIEAAFTEKEHNFRESDTTQEDLGLQLCCDWHVAVWFANILFGSFWIANLSSICRCICYYLKRLNLDAANVRSNVPHLYNTRKAFSTWIWDHFISFCYAIPAWYSEFIDINYVGYFVSMPSWCNGCMDKNYIEECKFLDNPPMLPISYGTTR